MAPVGVRRSLALRLAFAAGDGILCPVATSKSAASSIQVEGVAPGARGLRTCWLGCAARGGLGQLGFVDLRARSLKRDFLCGPPFDKRCGCFTSW